MLPLILLSAALLPIPSLHRFSPVDPAAITITADNVELNGAGRLDFKPDRKAFHVDPPEGSEGLSVTVRLWLGVGGQPMSCDVGRSALPEVAQTGCEQLMRSARFHLVPGYALSFRRGFVDVEFDFFKESLDGPEGETIFAYPSPAYTNTMIVYPPDETPADQVLHNTEGKFVVPVAADDYPPIAMRYGLETHSSLVLGISRDGKVRSCRPIGSPAETATAFLDNYTCDLFMRRGHFEFQSTALDYTGLHFRRSNMIWMIPR